MVTERYNISRKATKNPDFYWKWDKILIVAYSRYKRQNLVNDRLGNARVSWFVEGGNKKCEVFGYLLYKCSYLDYKFILI